MAADVTTFIRMLNGYDDQKQKTVGGGAGTSSTPITRDLLGGCSALESKELDLDLQVPSGWEKRLDLKSGKVYIQRCNSPNSSSSYSKTKSDDLNFPPQSKKPLNLLDDTTLKLRLSPSSSSSSPSSPSCYQSVCTLDKVKCALKRAKNETQTHNKKRSKSPSSHSNSSSSIMELSMDMEDEVEKKPKPISSSFAAGCPGCLLYVLVSKNNPQCPRCHTTVPLPQTDKRPRIDLNMSI